MSKAKRGKKAVNLSISADLQRAARSNDINLSAPLESAVARQLRRRRWLEENVGVIQAYNRDVEQSMTDCEPSNADVDARIEFRMKAISDADPTGRRDTVP